MKKRSNISLTRRVLVTFMSMAFFYLVIGDLIIFHQKALFNFDVFSDHPYSHNNKTDKNPILKLKDKKNKVSPIIYTFLSSQFEIKKFIPKSPDILLSIPPIQYSDTENHIFLLFFRGPPCK